MGEEIGETFNMEKIVIVFLITSCRKCGPINQTLNIVSNLDKRIFKAFLVSLYEETNDSMLPQFLSYVKHFCVHESKGNIIFGSLNNLKKCLSEINLNVVHSLGVFPAYAMHRIKIYPHIMTLRNEMWKDYIMAFGRLRGWILCRLQQSAMDDARAVIACSKTLSLAYKTKMYQTYNFIRNGVDLSKYKKIQENEKQSLRELLHIPKESFVYAYSGNLCDRKNQRFLLQTFTKVFADRSVILMLLGNGKDFATLKQSFRNHINVLFTGQVANVSEYLRAADAYVSTSKAEGMPNGVLEAMASGLPVVLSDIPQHMEIMEMDHRIGFSYRQGSSADLALKMKQMVEGDYVAMGKQAYSLAHKAFDAKKMSEQYQVVYKKIVHSGRIEG